MAHTDAFLSDEDADRMIELYETRKKGRRFQRAANVVFAGFVLGALGITQSRCFRENEDDVVKSCLGVCALTGIVGVGLNKLAKKRGGLQQEECDVEMFRIAASNPGVFDKPVHIYGDTPIAAAEKTQPPRRNS